MRSKKMRVLAVASEIYGSNYPPQSITGLAIMVRDIYEEVSKECDTYLYSTHIPLYSENESDKLHILDSNTDGWYKYVTISDVLNSFQCIRRGIKAPLSFIRNSAKKRMLVNRFESYIKSISPDIVNFHDPEAINVECARVCERLSVPYVLTDHLYIGNSAGCESYTTTIMNERIMFGNSNGIFSAISTGMRERILKDYPKLNPKNVYLTIDGTHFEAQDFVNTKQNGRKIILCVANVMERKNQVQLVRALSKLDADERKQFAVYFLGSDRSHTLQDAIRDYQCEDVAIYKGKVSSEEMPVFYKQAFAVITTTLCEGFGLTIIEGYTYGIPAIIPNDIDSFSDLYTEQSTVAIQDRTDNAIINAIQECISKEWNPELIKEKAKEFSMDGVGKSYVQMYKKILGDKYGE